MAVVIAQKKTGSLRSLDRDVVSGLEKKSNWKFTLFFTAMKQRWSWYDLLTFCLWWKHHQYKCKSSKSFQLGQISKKNWQKPTTCTWTISQPLSTPFVILVGLASSGLSLIDFSLNASKLSCSAHYFQQMTWAHDKANKTVGWGWSLQPNDRHLSIFWA